MRSILFFHNEIFSLSRWGKKRKKQHTYLVVGSSHSRIYKMTDFLTELFLKGGKEYKHELKRIEK